MPLTKNTPKSLIEINGKPFLEYQIELLKKNNILSILLCVGKFSEQIIKKFKDGKIFEVSITYSIEDKDCLLGTAGALKNAEHYLQDIFFVMYGDSFLPIDFQAVYEKFIQSDSMALMTIYKNQNEFDKSNVGIENNKITCYNKNSTNDLLDYIDYGLLIFDKKVLQYIPENTSIDLGRLFSILIGKKELSFFETSKRFYEIGSFAGIDAFKKFSKNL